MKNNFLFLLILLPYVLLSNTIDSTKSVDSTKNRKWEIGFSFSPDYSYRTLKSDADNQSLKEMRDTLEIPKFGFTTGINVVYHFNDRIVLETGLLFSDKGEKTKKTSFENVPSSQLPIYYTYKYHYLYLDIPLKVDYYLLTGKLKLFVTAGVSGNIFINQKTTLLQGHDNGDIQKNTTTFNPGFNRFNLAMIAGLGINYKLSSRMNLKVEPVYRRSLTSIANTPIKSYLYSTGLNMGISFKL